MRVCVCMCLCLLHSCLSNCSWLWSQQGQTCQPQGILNAVTARHICALARTATSTAVVIATPLTLHPALPPCINACLLHLLSRAPRRPAVLSAVQGLQVKAGFNQDAVVGITCGILVLLFLLQSYGTQRVGSLFAPTVVLWFIW